MPATPGPWIVKSDPVNTGGAIIYVCEGDNFRKYRKQIARWDTPHPDLETRDNAKLIAAAPSLLKENIRLRHQLNLICSEYCSWYDKGVPAMDAPGIAYHLASFARVALVQTDITKAETDLEGI